MQVYNGLIGVRDKDRRGHGHDRPTERCMMAMSEEQRRAYAKVRLTDDIVGHVLTKDEVAEALAGMEPDRTNEQYRLGAVAGRNGQPRDMRQSVLWLAGWDEAGA